MGGGADRLRWNFAEIFGVNRLEYGAICVILSLTNFVELRLVTDVRTVGQTDRRTHDDSIYRQVLRRQKTRVPKLSSVRSSAVLIEHLIVTYKRTDRRT